MSRMNIKEDSNKGYFKIFISYLLAFELKTTGFSSSSGSLNFGVVDISFCFVPFICLKVGNYGFLNVADYIRMPCN